MDARVASRYAKALFRAAKAQGMVAAVGNDLRSMGLALESEPRLARLLSDPDKSRSVKLSILEKLFSERVTGLTMQAIRLMLEKRREGGFLALRDQYEVLRRAEENEIPALVTSSRDLTDDQKARLVQKLASATGKSIQPKYSVDPTILGGVKVELAGFVMDGSVSGGLNRLRETLKYDFLKQR